MKKLLLFSMCLALSIFTVFAQVNPAISVHNPKAEIKQQTKNLTLQKEKDFVAEHGPTIVVPEAEEGGSRAIGDDCTNPIVISLPAALPYNVTGQTNCGRGNTYSSTCLGSYDGGEDIMYRLDVTSNVTVTITMNPGTTQWTGIYLSATCGNSASCLATATGSGATPRVLSNQALTAGNSYYIMVDTYPDPTCIPSFSLNITIPPPPPPNLTCATALNYGNVNDPAISGVSVQNGSLWYTFTNPSPNDMNVTVSLCGSSYDSQLAIYTACGVPYSYQNDDFCGVGSQITFVLPAGQTWIARVYGWGSAWGNFILIITTPPLNDICTDAEFISGPYPQLVSRTTIGATIDCPGVLGWNAVWYKIDLPYLLNNLSIDFCGNSPALTDLGIVYYNDCLDCNAYNLLSVTACTGGWDLTALNIPGPSSIYFPAYVGATGRNFQFTVDVLKSPNVIPLSNWAILLGGLLIVVFAFFMFRRRL